MRTKGSNERPGWLSRLLRRPFGSSKTRTGGLSEALLKELTGPEGVDDSIHIESESFSFSGRRLRSPNGRWVLALGSVLDWDAQELSSDDANETAFLLGDGKLACQITSLRRPREAALCDAGNFAINDHGPADDFIGAGASLSVFSTKGECLSSLRLGAAIEMPALSPDGRILAFHTLAAPSNSTNQEDGESLFVVEAISGAVRWRANLPVIWPLSIDIDGAESRVIVRGHSGESYRYTFDGEFLDSDLLEAASLEADAASESGYALFDRACELLQGPAAEASRDARSECTSLLEKALGKEMSPNAMGLAHRLLGEIAEAEGDVDLALAAYEAAIASNPRVGVKRRLDALRKAEGKM